MKKIILLFFLIFFSCSNEYVDFHNEKNLQIEQDKNIENQLNNFSFEKIGYLTGVIIKETPSLDLLDEMVSKIDNSKSRVYVEIYIFTEKRLKKALINAHKRGVQVKVLLEKNVYKASYLNNEVYKDFKNAGIEVKYSNSQNYSLNHTKLMIVDDEAIISTGNYSYSSFKYNREFFILLQNKEFLDKLLEIFQADFSGIRKNIYQNNLVLSPFSSRTKLEYLLKNAQKSIKIYCLNFDDISIENILLERQKSGINIQIIFPELKKVESNKEVIEKFKNAGISVKILDKPDLHAKSILIDEKYLYLGSVNFSQSSIDKNREIGILFTNQDLIKYFLEIFHKDFNSKL